MTKVSENFDVRELVPPEIYAKFGAASRWFVRKEIVNFAEFIRAFFTEHFRIKLNNKDIKVIVIVNNWHTGGDKKYCGFRPPSCTEGGDLSQHRLMNGIDTKIFIVYPDGKRVEVDYKYIHHVVHDNEATFMKHGLTTIEDVAFATTWMHWDFRWTGMDKILVVKP